MNEIKLNKLSLRDFQGGTFTLDAKGKDVFIFAANAVGKTRLVSAFTWLLFGKDALGRSDFEIKNINEDGQHIHNLEHTVEAKLDINGQMTILKKIFSEKWTKKRGQAEREFSGHSTDHYIDGVPIKEKDYLARISEIAGDESRFRLLTSPTAFPALPPLPTLKDPTRNQRSILLEVCGNISDADVITSHEKLTMLTTILGKRSLDDHRKIVATRRSEINKEIEKFPIRIDEVRRGMPNITGIDRGEAERSTQDLETALNDAKLRFQGVNTGGPIGNLSQRLSGLNADLRKMEDAHRSESLSTLNRLNQQISEIGVQVGADRRRVQAIDSESKHKESQLQRMGKDLPGLREQWISVDSETFKCTISDICPTCGQSLPSESIQEASDKALASFNSNKADRLKTIHDQGISQNENCDRVKNEIDALQKEKEMLETAIPNRELHLKNLTDERDTLKESSEDFSSLPHWSETFGEIEAYEQEIKAEREGKAQDLEIAQATIREQQGRYDLARAKINRFVQREQGEKRIEELLKEEKMLSKEFEKLESELYLMDEFIKTKVSMLTERINSKFEMVRFKLFNQLINGGIEECCIITVNGVPIDGGLNNGARINAGLEIVKVLQEYYQLKAPVFADNAEAVNTLFDVGCQMIKLFVSEDKQLRIEIAKKERMAA